MINFPGNILKVDGVQLRLYSILDPLWTLSSGFTPYIKHTDTPRFTWIAEGDQGVTLLYRLQIIWVSVSGFVETELDTDYFLYNNFYTVSILERLVHTKAKDAGGYYRVVIGVKESDIDEQFIGGVFRINYTPTRPTNLTIA